MSIFLVDNFKSEVRSFYSLYGAGTSKISQSFTGKAGNLTFVSFYLMKEGNPAGNAYSKLYSHSGNYGLTSVPDTLLATSDAIDVSGLSDYWSNVVFSFTGGEQYTLQDNIHYCITIEYDGGDNDNYIIVGRGVYPYATHSGNAAYYYTIS